MSARNIPTYSHSDSMFSAQAAFDLASRTYDESFESLPGTKRLRKIFSSLLSNTFVEGSSLLELNCGTGTDALMLGHKGYSVLATDFSPAMIEATRAKVHREGLDNLIETKELSFLDLRGISGSLFDGAYSDMGGLNCTSDLPLVAEQLAPVVKPGGYFVASVMSDFCLWETVSFLLRGNLQKAFRRAQTQGAIASVGGQAIRVSYFSPGEVSRAFAPYFEVKKVIGLNILTPPPTSIRFYKSFPRAIQELEALDDRISTMPFFRRIGDHFCILLQRSLPGGRA